MTIKQTEDIAQADLKNIESELEKMLNEVDDLLVMFFENIGYQEHLQYRKRIFKFESVIESIKRSILLSLLVEFSQHYPNKHYIARLIANQNKSDDLE